MLDARSRVPSHVTPASHVRPKGRIGKALKSYAQAILGDHMLEESQLPFGTDDSEELGKGLLGIDATEHERDNTRVERAIISGQLMSVAIDHRYRNVHLLSGALRLPTQVGFRLNSHHLRDRTGIPVKVGADAGTDLDHSPAQTCH